MVSAELVTKTLDMVKKAGQIIVPIYHESTLDNTHLDISYKEDRFPLTRADKASNEYICNSLRAQFDIPVLSEESLVDYEIRKDWERFWLVDPLDGTKDFIAKNDDFTILVTLIENNVPVFGVIYAPARQELFYGMKGQGAYFQAGAGEVFQLPMVHHQQYIIGISRFHNSERVQTLIRENGITEIRENGSALKFGYLAKGDLNLYPRFSGSMEWDIAAGHIIIKEANCSIFDVPSKQEPAYNKPDLRNGYFIAYSNDIDIQSLKI